MNVTLGIMVDIAPLADYTLNGQFYPGEEKMDWPDPVFPYSNCYEIDNHINRKLEYAVIKINDFINSEFMRARYVDSLGNWRRTPRLWDAAVTPSYQVTWNLPDDQQPIQRQYINWEKNTGSNCDPANFGTRRCIDIQVSPPPMFENYLYLLLSYIDPPLDPQGRAFPWDPGDPYPRPGDNRGTGEGFPDPTPGDIVIAVPCTGRVHTYFNTTEFGGDNFIILGFLYIGIPGQPGSTFVGQYLESAKIEVWRWLNIAVCSMDKPWYLLGAPPSFYPPHELVAGKFLDSYIEINFLENYFINMEYEPTLTQSPTTDFISGSDMDYVDDFPPDGPQICNFQNQEEFVNPHFHPTHAQCKLPPHTIQATGIKNYDNLQLLGKTPGFPTAIGSHYHIFIALDAAWDLVDHNPTQYNYLANKIFLHELGHQIVALQDDSPPCNPNNPPLDPHVMIQGWNSCVELKFHDNHLQSLRAGPSCDQRTFACGACP